MPTPALSVAYIVAAISSAVGLFLTQGLIDNNTAKLVTGLAVTFVPLGLAALHTFFHVKTTTAQIDAQARVTAASVTAATPPPPPAAAAAAPFAPVPAPVTPLPLPPTP